MYITSFIATDTQAYEIPNDVVEESSYIVLDRTIITGLTVSADWLLFYLTKN